VTTTAAAVQLKRVFLSYAWENDEFRLWVKRFATRLRDDGVDARLDDWHLPRNGNIAEFMNREVREADWVLVLCSPGYQAKVRATEDGVRVAGVGWETRLLTSTLLVTNQNKVLAVLARGEWQTAAPDSLLGQVYFDLSRPETFEKQYAALLTAILGNEEKAPPLGALPRELTEESVGALRYDAGDEVEPVSRRPARLNRWARLRQEALAFLAVAVVLDLLLAWFVKATLTFAPHTFVEYCVMFSVVALVLAAAVRWLSIVIRRRRLARG
jgi:hypothetical protein